MLTSDKTQWQWSSWKHSFPLSTNESVQILSVFGTNLGKALLRGPDPSQYCAELASFLYNASFVKLARNFWWVATLRSKAKCKIPFYLLDIVPQGNLNWKTSFALFLTVEGPHSWMDRKGRPFCFGLEPRSE